MMRRDAPALTAAAAAPAQRAPAVPGEPLIRPGGREDIAGVDAVMRAAFDPRFGETWRPEQIAATLAAPGGRLLTLCEAGGGLIGFSLVRALAGEAELLLLAIAPAARRRGLGGRMLLTALEDCRQAGASAVFLEVREDNHPARRLYWRHGFVEIGRRPGYYRGEGQRRYHAVSMRRALDD